MYILLFLINLPVRSRQGWLYYIIRRVHAPTSRISIKTDITCRAVGAVPKQPTEDNEFLNLIQETCELELNMTATPRPKLT